MALQTQGFQLQALPPMPVIPDNVGKIDMKAIYDRVKQGLDTTNQILLTPEQQAAETQQLRAQEKTALAQQAVLPSQTEANIAQNQRSTALASPQIVAGEAGKALAGLDADLATEQNRRDNQRFLAASLTPAQRIVLAQNGPPTSSTSSTVLTPDKTFQSTQTKTANVGGEVVPVATATETSPATPVLTTIPGINGNPLGTAVTTVGADGRPTTHVAAAPLAALNNIVTGTTYQKVGEERDPVSGNQQDIYQAFTTSAAGGQPKPVGAPVKVTAGSAPPGVTPTAPAQPFMSRDALKAVEDTQGELQALQGRKVELDNIRRNAEAFIQAGQSGRFLGPLESFRGAAEAQQFTGSVQNALSTALQPLRGTGRVSNTEFQQALSALPTIKDTAETINQKLGYLNLVTDWSITRQQAILDNLGKGLNRYQAFQQAIKETPLPEVPQFYSAQPTTPAAAPAANTSAPTITSQQQYDALAPGASYLDSKGTPHIKGGPRG